MLDFAKSLSCYVNACSHKRIVEFVSWLLGEIGCAAKLKFLWQRLLFLQLISASLYKLLQETTLTWKFKLRKMIVKSQSVHNFISLLNQTNK